MNAYDSIPVEGTDLDQRDVRALTEAMSVLPEGGDIYTVVGENGGTYTVDGRDGACTCPDATYRSVECKHQKRVAFATSERPIPAWVNRGAIDEHLGAHVDSTPRVAATDGGQDIIDAGDDGEVLDAREPEPAYTYHVEAPEQGGERYVRCESCGVECIPADPDRLMHRKDCPHADR